MPYEILPHTADFRLRARGATPEELFRDAMRGMFSIMRPRMIARNDAKQNAKLCEIQRRLRLRAADREALLVDFLNEVLYLSETHQEIYEAARFTTLTDTTLEAGLSGRKRESVELQIKAVTYHGLQIVEKEGRLEATILFDV